MCGIAGIAGGDPRDVAPALRAMTDSMRHRGPDDRGQSATSALGGVCACRLAIQDPSGAGHQPMRSERSGRWVAFNGEIYNVDALRRELEGRGHRFAGHSDTEVVLAAHDEWGDAFLSRLRGMFGLAIFDPERGRLLLARDRLGIKPLYLTTEGDRLAFASEVRTLLAAGVAAARLSEEGFATFLSLGAVQDPLTLVDGVRALEPGHWAVWEEGTLRTGSYWSLPDAFAPAEPPPSREVALRELRDTLEEAVRLHLISDRPLGVFLSGGIDSSALVALASGALRTPLHTVSVVFPQESYSEAPYIDLVRERYGTEHVAINVDEPAMLGAIPDAVAAMDQPTQDGINTYIVSRAAIEAGLTVSLSGLGGDELFGGYPSFRDVPRMIRVRDRLPAVAGRAGAALLDRAGRGTDRHDKLARWLRAEDGGHGAYALRRELFSGAMTGRLLGGEARARWRLPDALDDLENTVSLQELSVYMRNVLLRDSDVMSMAHSLEIRVPFLDHVVVERAARLPGAWKRPDGTPKALLVEALGDLLPREIVDRPKQGFVLPVDHWLRGGLRRQVDAALSDPAFGGQVARALDADAVREVWRRFEGGEVQWMRPWALYVAKCWGERHLP